MEGNHCTHPMELDKFHDILKPDSRMEEDILNTRKMLTFAYQNAGQMHLKDIAPRVYYHVKRSSYLKFLEQYVRDPNINASYWATLPEPVKFQLA